MGVAIVRVSIGAVGVSLRPRVEGETIASSSCDTEVRIGQTAQWKAVCGKTVGHREGERSCLDPDRVGNLPQKTLKPIDLGPLVPQHCDDIVPCRPA